MDLYMNTFVNMVGSPLEHLFFYETVENLIGLKVNISANDITSLIKQKYTKPSPSPNHPHLAFPHPILYHKSFSLPQSKYSLSQKPEFNY
jgi:hypothetical protein